MEVNAIRTRFLRWSPGALLAVLLLWGIKHWAFAAPPLKLLTVPVRIADVEQTVLASGVIQPRKLVSVGAQASGRIIAMHVNLGDQVHKGQLIAEIDPQPQQNALNTAEAVLAQDRAQRASRTAALKLAELTFKRAAVTLAQEASSQADYETAEATYKGAQADIQALDAQIKQAAIAVDLARVTLGYTKVIAPMDGTVVAIVAPEGQTVNAVQAAPTIVKLADLETMTVKAQISEADITRGPSWTEGLLHDPRRSRAPVLHPPASCGACAGIARDRLPGIRRERCRVEQYSELCDLLQRAARHRKLRSRSAPVHDRSGQRGAE